MLDYSCIDTKQILNRIYKSPDSRIFGDLYISSCPGIGRDLATDIKTIQDLNIVIVLSLLEEHELSHLGAKSLLKELSVKNIQWMRFEIENFGVPKFSQYALLNQNINTISNDIINGKNILIHCMAGLGRTGMIAALILIKLGIDINQSIKLIRNIRPGSIETEEQEKFVRNFKLI